MAYESVTLQKFTPEEIIFDDAEITQILLFFFPGTDDQLRNYTMSHPMREFAQGLLVEAVIKSQAMGWVEYAFTLLSPGRAPSLRSILGKLAKGGLQYLKKSKKLTQLDNLEIYETVRKVISDNFKTEYHLRLDGAISKKATSKMINYALVRTQVEKIWGRA